LSNSGIQTYIAQKFAQILSKELKTEISISKVKISFNLHLILEDVYINDQYHSPLFRTHGIDCKIRHFSLIKRKIEFSKVLFDNNEIAIVKYKNDSIYNYQFLLNYFKSKDTTVKKTTEWKITGKSFEIKNTSFKFQNQDNMNFVSTSIDFNNLYLKNLNCKFDTLLIKGDTINLDINHLSFTDKSGFALNNLTSRINIFPGNIGLKYLHIETASTNLSLDCNLTYDKKEDLNDFINKVKIKTDIRPSKLNTKDLAYFIKELNGMDNLMTFSGQILGKISNLKLRNFRLNYGRSTSFEGAISLNGLPNISETFIRMTVNRLTTTKADLEDFILPGKYNNRIKVPEQLLSFGNVFIKGDFTGFYNDFNAYADFVTQNGTFKTDITLKKDKHNQLNYKGHISANQFNIGLFLNTPNVLGKLNMDAEILGTGITAQTVKVKMTGNINQLQFKGNVYDSIAIEGDITNNQFNGFLNVHDDKIDFKFLGKIDYAEETPVFDFTATIKDANLYKLRLLDSDSLGILSTQLNFNFTGKNADDIIGVIKVENTSYKRANKTYKLDELKLLTYNDTLNQRNIEIYSDYINAFMVGNFKFKDLPTTFNMFIHNYLPSFDAIKSKSNIEYLKSEQSFTFNVLLKQTNELTDLLIPKLKISPNALIYGSYDSKQSYFDLNGDADFISYNNQYFDKWYLEGKTDNRILYLKTGCKRLNFANNLGIDNFNIHSLMQRDSVFYSFFWRDTLRKAKNSGDIRGIISFTDVPLVKTQIIRAEVLINDSIWRLMDQNFISFNKTDITISNLSFGDVNQSIRINGNISKNPSDKMILTFNHFNISQFDFLTVNNNIDLDGITNGNIDLVDLYNSPNFFSDLTINGICFNKDNLGDLKLFSTWDKEKDGLFVKTNLIYTGNNSKDTTLFGEGFYYPNNKTNNFDFNIRLDRLKLRSLTHYFKSFTSNFDGQALGNISFKGTIKNPEVNGKILLLRSKIYIDYLGISYSINNTDSIEISTKYFKFKNLGISYEKGRAVLDGKITHNGFTNIKIDLTVNYKNLMVLNTQTSDNELFYGKAFATGIFRIFGPDNDIHMDIRAKTEKETYINVPLIDKTITYENNFIKFIQKQKKEEIISSSSNRFKGITMKFDLETTPDANIGIRLETPQTVGDINARGTGNIQMIIDNEGKFKMYGEYTLNSEGLYFFTIQNILTKKFNIQNGGTIVWSGDPYNAIVDLKAIYNVKASLYPILVGTAENVSKKKMQIQDIISIQGNLSNPTIDFDINLPNVDQDTKDRFFSIVDRNDKNEMLQQSFSLLVLNSFISQNRNTYSSSVGSGVGSSSSEMISNQVSNWLSQISKDFDIGFNYLPGDQLSSQELQVALSTQLFNDRVTLDGNFGVGGNLRTETQTSQNNLNNNIIGDVNVEVKLTDDGRFRLKAFNRSNTNNFTNTYSLYTQGIGLFYRRDFDNIKELFNNPKNK
jgi:hypothetical protein